MRAPALSSVLVALLLVADVKSEEGAGAGEATRAHKVVVKRTPLGRALAPAPFTLDPAAAAAAAKRSQRSAANDRWARFISEYARGGRHDTDRLPGWARDAVMVDLPLAGESEGRPSSVPVLVLPVPVPAPAATGCSAEQDKSERFEFHPESPSRGGSRRPRPPPRKKYRPVVQDVDEDSYPEDYEDEPAPPPRARPLRPPPAPKDRPRPFGFEQQQPAIISPPSMGEGKVSPQVLVHLFRSQKPRAPQMPPVLTRHRRLDVEAEPAPAPAPAPAPTPAPAPIYGPPKSPPSPPPPRFDRPLFLRGELTVYRADYTEPYTALWEPTTGAARVQLHDGATTTYRAPPAGGRVLRVAMTLDRSGETEVMRCAVLQGAPDAADRVPPALPDTSQFSFDGYVEFGSVRAERWSRTEAGGAGELGGARGESLVYRHELLLTRIGGFATPLQYSVAVDSSVLGPDCDGYVHRYHEVRAQDVDPSLFQIDLKTACEQMEETTELARVEPLREFTLPARDPRHDQLFREFTSEFERKYEEPAEEAVRKNLFTQNTRFVASGNRMGASFEMGVNFLADRLDEELAQLLGVVPDDEHFAAEDFPHQRNQLRDLEGALPDQFDWRDKGGVSPVRYQGSCSSCWAFAVAGAVEGALFRQTGRLVPLSEQALVDCAHPYGGRGCGGTWPSHAYDFVQDRGLPALDDYTAYQAKVLQCSSRVPPATHISAHVNVTQYSVPALKVAIHDHAPSVVIIDAQLKSFQTYKKGVFYDDRCARERRGLKHAVVAVGWGQRGGEAHFVLKNSWSAAWGDGGYVRVHAPSNTCGVLTLPSYPRLERADARRL